LFKRRDDYVKVWIDNAVKEDDGNDEPEDHARRRGDA
jgi:hypothetical protein